MNIDISASNVFAFIVISILTIPTAFVIWAAGVPAMCIYFLITH